MKWAAARPSSNPANVIRAVTAPNSGGATQGEYPSKPRLVPATTLSTLNGRERPNRAHRWSSSSGAAVRWRGPRGSVDGLFVLI
jgi:hypothetical protein